MLRGSHMGGVPFIRGRENCCGKSHLTNMLKRVFSCMTSFPCVEKVRSASNRTGMKKGCCCCSFSQPALSHPSALFPMYGARRILILHCSRRRQWKVDNGKMENPPWLYSFHSYRAKKHEGSLGYNLAK